MVSATFCTSNAQRRSTPAFSTTSSPVVGRRPDHTHSTPLTVATRPDTPSAMRYRVGDHVIDQQTRTVVEGAEVVHVEP